MPECFDVDSHGRSTRTIRIGMNRAGGRTEHHQDGRCNRFIDLSK